MSSTTHEGWARRPVLILQIEPTRFLYSWHNGVALHQFYDKTLTKTDKSIKLGAAVITKDGDNI